MQVSATKRGALSSVHLIALILLVTAVGIGIYYYQQGKASRPPVITGQLKYPVEKALTEETARTNNIVYGGIPKFSGKSTLTVLKNRAFYTGYCDDRKNPLWVAYRLDTKTFHEKLKRPKGFKTDMRTLARVAPGDYSKSGYDRGHMAPNSSIAQRYGLEAQLETFMMSNIVPQAPELNRKVWQRLEKLEDEYADNMETVWVITGPIFDEHIQTLEKNIEIPDAFYKMIFDEEKGNIRAMAMIIPQTVTGKEPLDSFFTSIDEIEKLTGLDFLWPLSDDVETRLEAATTHRLW